MLDDIVIIPGFRKCGTTSLYDVLASTEKFRTCEIKEPQLLIAEDFRENKQLYLENFAMHNGPILDGSTYYIWEENSLKFIKNNFKTSKAIVMIRNPIDRFYSAYYHNKLKQVNSECRTISEVISSFIAGNENEGYLKNILDLNDLNFFRKNGLADFDFKENGLLPNYLYINEGMYRERINYLKKTGIEYLIITFEEFVKDFESTMIKVTSFLEIDLEKNIKIKKSNQATKKSKFLVYAKKYLPGIVSVIPKSVKNRLSTYFRKEVETNKDIDREILEEIYESEIEFWKKNLDGAQRYW